MPLPMPGIPAPTSLGALAPMVMPQSGIVQQLLAQNAAPSTTPFGVDPMLLQLIMSQQQQQRQPGRQGPGPAGPTGPSESFDVNGLSNELLSELPKWWDPQTQTWKGVTLNPRAMRSFRRASNILGEPIQVTGSFRSLQDQQNIYAKKPDLAAPPGHSFHQTGLAFDLDMNAYPEGSSKYRKLVNVLERLGWHRFDPGTEPWHFSFRVTG